MTETFALCKFSPSSPFSLLSIRMDKLITPLHYLEDFQN